MASPSDAADPGHASDPFRVPDTFARGGGPVAGNPFLSDDPLHRVWAERTRKAEETVSRLTADWLSTNEPYTAARAATLIVAKFDAWAERAVSIVWCDRALQHCDEWLVAEANAWIEGVTRTYAETAPPFSVKTLLMDLRRRLGAQVYVWKAAARRVCADYQVAMPNPSAEPPGSSEHVLGANPYREDDPNYQEWTTTNQMLANGLARIHAAFFAVLPRHRDAATIGDWLAIWTVTYFDAIAKVHVLAVVQDEEAGADAFAAALEACRVQALGVLNQRLAGLARQMEGLMNAFPGAKACNTECVRFVEDVQRRVSPEVTRRLVEHFAEWLVQACAWDRAEEPRAPPDGPTVPPSGEETGMGSTIVPPIAPPAASPGESAATAPREAPDEGTSEREPSTVAVQNALPRNWDAVEIRFVSDFTFQAVVNGTVRPPQNYAEVGLGDGRHGRPKAAWETLRTLAESGGVVASTRTAADWPRLEKRIQELRRVLQAVFKVPDDPIPYRDGAYRTRFTIRVGRSYNR
jgi:hypothetical protein